MMKTRTWFLLSDNSLNLVRFEYSIEPRTYREEAHLAQLPSIMLLSYGKPRLESEQPLTTWAAQAVSGTYAGGGCAHGPTWTLIHSATAFGSPLRTLISILRPFCRSLIAPF